jgi:hypothetical protein
VFSYWGSLQILAGKAEEMIYTFTNDKDPQRQFELAQCACGEPAFVETNPYVRWQQCATCADHRVLTWTSCQTPRLVLRSTRRAA